MADFATPLDGRIKALTMSQGLLSRRNWHGISLLISSTRSWRPTPLTIIRTSRVFTQTGTPAGYQTIS
jgi:hypothetical protein